MPITVKWFPAHMGPVSTGENRNQGADRAARALTSRDTCPSPRHAEDEDRDEVLPITSYREVLESYREGRRVYPPPHRKLTRQEATTLRQRQARAVWIPVVAKHVCPEVYASDVCAVRGKGQATMAHILWNCKVSEGTTDALPPSLEKAVSKVDYDGQRQAVQQTLVALERQRLKAQPCEGAVLVGS